MDTWLWAESPSTSFDEEPRVKSARFGDGYSQDMPDGINTSPQSWSVQFNGVSDAAGNEMIAFLRQKAGAERFFYTPLWSTAPIIVKATRWRRSHEGRDLSSINVTFVQVFEP